MKKKFNVYLALLILVVSFLAPSISAFGESFNANHDGIEDTAEPPHGNMVDSFSTSSQEILSSTSTDSTTDSSTTQSTQSSVEKKQSNVTEESQPRGPTNKNSDSSKVRAKRTAVRKEIGDIITKATITDASGNPLTEANQWTNIQMNFEFSLPNNTVSEGDTSTITLPKELKFLKNQIFDVRNSNGDLIAEAQIDEASKTVTLTYTDFVETHSDVSGSLFFNVRVDTTNVTENKNIPITVEINGVPKFIGNIDYEKVLDHPDEKFTKYNWFLNDEGTEIRYVLRVNSSGENYKNTVVEDNLISEGVSYDKSSFKIHKGNWVINQDGVYELRDEEDVTDQYSVNFKDSDKGFTIDFGDINGEGYQVAYNVKVGHKPIHGELFQNKAQMRADSIVVQEANADIIYQTAGGNADGHNYTIHIHKKNPQGESLAGATFEVIRDSVGTSVGKIVTDSSGNGSLSGLLKDNYTLKEIQAPEGYQILTEEIKISPDDFDSSKEVFKEIVNTKIELISIHGQKTWKDSDDQDGKRPGSIKVNLLANGTVVDSKEVRAADGWKYEFTNLPKYENGQEIVYTITEDQVPDYNTAINGFDITNSYTPGKTSVSVTKAWNDQNNQDGLRPNSVQVQLYADGKEVGSPVELMEANQWRHTWNDLPEKANGQTIKYTVKEVTAVTGYTSTVDDSDLGNVTITNTHTPEVTQIAGQKTWKDSDNQDGKRPEKIKINLLANGNVVATKEVSETDGWKYQFENLPKYENGQAIDYTVTEDQVTDYSTEIKGFDITNSYTPGKTSVSVTKAWDDQDNQDGLRPNSIKVQLYANDQAVGQPITLTEKNHWTYTWMNLETRMEGQLIAYTIKELTEVKGYKAVIDDTNPGNIIITNVHKPLSMNSPQSNSDQNINSNRTITSSSKSHRFPMTGSKGSVFLTVLGIFVIGSLGIIIKKRS
ncbi:Cna B-type domain-containing protein [Enterococcus hirae]|nr:Cna B-type domain-containing protein [Enterococcus faecium]